MVGLLAAPSLAPGAVPPPPTRDSVQLASSTTDGIVVATFNILGHSHTEPGGAYAWMDSGLVRLDRAVRLLRKFDISVVGLQEVHRPQYDRLVRRVSDYTVFPGPQVDQRNKQNVVAWRTNEFDLVRGWTVRMTYKNGRKVPMPVVRLREKATGQDFFVITVHNAPGLTAQAVEWRRQAMEQQIALTERLLGRGLPVFMTGDMNDRVTYFCRYTASGAMIAAAGGSNRNGTCEPPPGRIARVDWVFGSKRDVTFSDYRFLRTPLVRKTSDHPLIIARAVVR
jgi:endonuclease/exonuclease/phosphatase family metal-dependent hydrolase